MRDAASSGNRIIHAGRERAWRPAQPTPAVQPHGHLGRNSATGRPQTALPEFAANQCVHRAIRARMRFTVAVAVAVTVIAALVPSRAHADRDSFIGIGVLSSVSTGTHAMAGIGGELTLTSFDDDFVGWGSYGQVEAGKDLSAKT